VRERAVSCRRLPKTPDMKRDPRIAIVSDPLVQRGGAERVVEAIAAAFPDAPIFALLYDPQTGPASLASRVTPSWLNAIPGATRKHRAFLPLYRQAIESLDVSAYDIIISSHHTVAKSVLTRADQMHVCYCHTPMRALWERPFLELQTLPKPLRPLGAALFSHLREWDVTSSSRVQHYIANSATTQRRIAAYYRRDAVVLAPPIDTSFFTPGGELGDWYLVASRPVPYKRVDIAIEATRILGRPLTIVGGAHAIANAPPHVKLLGHVEDDELRALMRGTRGLLYSQYEDFGMAPLEVNACGRAVIAYGAGGALETVVDGITGVLAAEQSVDAFVGAMRRFEATSFDANVVRAHAQQYSTERFIDQLQHHVMRSWELHVSRR
jgi:glycosyltransferase involved in cell wall biosynthesis